jgi:hypothetical protein
MLQCSKSNRVKGMDEFGFYRGEAQRIPGWRGIASAWAVALFVVALFAGFDALASWRPAPAYGIGVVIPRHDPACEAAALPALPKGCPGAAFEPRQVPPISGW